MATHSRILAWEIPWTEEPGKGVHGVSRVRHDLATKPPPPPPIPAGGPGKIKDPFPPPGLLNKTHDCKFSSSYIFKKCKG